MEMSLADQLSYRPITEMENSFRREEIKEQKRERGHNDICATFTLRATNHIASNQAVIIIRTV